MLVILALRRQKWEESEFQANTQQDLVSKIKTK
jgi:hypothetical protein